MSTVTQKPAQSAVQSTQADLDRLTDALTDDDRSTGEKLSLIREFCLSTGLLKSHTDKDKYWQTIEFTGFTPDDSRSSLLRRWTGELTGTLSDGQVVVIPIVSEQSDTPLRIGEDVCHGLVLMEIARTSTTTKDLTKESLVEGR